MGSVLLRRESISSTIRCRGWSPSFCGRRRGVAAQPPQVSVSPLTRRGGGFPIAPATPSGRLPCSLLVAQRWQVAAALSAAVTTTPKQENAPTLHGREPSKEESSLFPATLRERGSGGEALLLEKRPLPQRLPLVIFSGGSAREGTFLSEKSPPSHHFIFPYWFQFWTASWARRRNSLSLALSLVEREVG